MLFRSPPEFGHFPSQHLIPSSVREFLIEFYIPSPRPFVRFHFLPWGGRSTAIRLSTGDVWVLASTPLTINTKETIDKLGPVK